METQLSESDEDNLIAASSQALYIYLMGFIKDGQQILRRMRFQGIVDQEMDQQLWGEVDNKRKRVLENKRIRMFLYNRNDPIELDIEYYLNNVLTAGMYI